MTSFVDARGTAALRRAAVRATYAPSIRNTQPWRFVLQLAELCIYADRARQLKMLDPVTRQLMISCGSALMNARVSIAASGYGARVERRPDVADPDLVARITMTAHQDMPVDFAALDRVLELRQTNRRRFSDDEVPAEVQDGMRLAAAAEDCALFVVNGEEHRLAVARLSREATALEDANPAYRAELAAWTTDDLGRRDGVPGTAVPQVDALLQDSAPRYDGIGGTGHPPPATRSTQAQCLVLLATAADGPSDWLRAGEALERILLEITKRGFVAAPLDQAVEVPSTRAALRAELGMSTYPQVMLRVGQAPLTPAARRRRLVDVLVEEA